MSLKPEVCSNLTKADNAGGLFFSPINVNEIFKKIKKGKNKFKKRIFFPRVEIIAPLKP